MMGPLNTDAPLLLNDVKQSGFGSREPRGEAFNALATVTSINGRKDDSQKPTDPPKFVYPACATPGCNKKVTPISGGGGWHCTKCDTTCQEPRYRYNMQLFAADMSGGAWMTGFDMLGEGVFGVSAQDLVAKKVRSPYLIRSVLNRPVHLPDLQCRRVYSDRG